ncbi:MAG: kinase [Luteimonas sp.]
MPTAPHPNVRGFAPVLVAEVLDDARDHGARVFGIVGVQGSGKSTLAAQVAALAASRGLRVAVVSLDDFYLDRDARLALAHDVHPLLATRGPPGTHDLALAFATLDALRERRSVAVPRFDKGRDRRLPRDAWPRVDAADLVILEGWCLATPPELPQQLIAPINALERDEDGGGVWRRHGNAALANDYPALWQRIDRLLLLQGPGFDVVPEWRWQQETARHAMQPEQPAMSRVQVARFVQHFERVSRQALRTLPDIADRTIRLDADRRPWRTREGAGARLPP